MTVTNWYLQSPIFFNPRLHLGGRPIYFSSWANNGIFTLADIFGAEGLRSFTDIQNLFNLPGSSFFFYLQLRTAMRTYGVPWDGTLGLHPFHKALTGSKGLVSALYAILMQAPNTPLSLDRIWKQDLPSDDNDLDWHLIWQNLSLSSRNPNHRIIHYNFIHRSYFTPNILFKFKALPSPNCTLCSQKSLGTFFHMVWECPGIADFWKKVCSALSIILSKQIPYSPTFLLLNDTSNLDLPAKLKRLLLAGLTAAKRLIACRWKPPHLLSLKKWLLDFIDIAIMERWAANLHLAKPDNILCWDDAITTVKSLL